MLSEKAVFEHILYFTAALFINLILFNLLYYFIFRVPIPETRELPPLKVEIQQIATQVGTKKERKRKRIGKPKHSKVVSSKTAISNVPVGKKGEIPVKVQKKPEKNIEILESIKRIALKKWKERQKLAKQVGEISAVVSQKKLTIRVGTRKLTYIPPPPTFKVKEFPSSVKIKIWVDPAGKVIKAIILQRSGIAEIDNGLLKFVKKLRFEPIETGEIQEGVITFTFTAE